MADNHTIARPYAEAVFELARSSDSLDRWSAALELGARLMADGRVAKLLARPALSDEDRLGFVTDLFRAADGNSLLAGGSKQGTNFLKLLIEYDRLDVLPEIAGHYDELKDRVENTVDVTVSSATELSDEQKQAIVSALQERLGRDVRLETELDENLLGGAVIRAGDVVIDGSLRSRLVGLSNALVA